VNIPIYLISLKRNVIIAHTKTSSRLERRKLKNLMTELKHAHNLNVLLVVNSLDILKLFIIIIPIMTTMQKIIDKLWKCSWPSECEKGKCTCVGRSIYLGDVMARMEKAGLMEGHFIDLVKIWIPCDLSKSLQAIELCGYEEYEAYDMYEDGITVRGTMKVKRLKDPNAEALCLFLNQLIKADNQLFNFICLIFISVFLINVLFKIGVITYFLQI